MKQFLLFIITFLSFQTIQAQSLQLLKEDGSPVENDTILVSGNTLDSKIEVPVFVKNIANISKDVYAKIYAKQQVEGSQFQFCWNSCFGPGITQSSSYLTIEPGDTAINFYCDYTPNGFDGVTEIMCTFFVNKDASDSVSVTITYNVVATGIENIAKLKESIKCYPNPVIDKVNFDYTINNNKSNIIKIYDLVGNLVKQINVANSSQSTDIDLSNLNSGFYIWTFESDGVPVKSERLIKR